MQRTKAWRHGRNAKDVFSSKDKLSSRHVILYNSFFQHVAQLKWLLLPTIFVFKGWLLEAWLAGRIVSRPRLFTNSPISTILAHPSKQLHIHLYKDKRQTPFWMKIRESLDIRRLGGSASRGGWYLVVISYVGFGGSTSIVGGWRLYGVWWIYKYSRE